LPNTVHPSLPGLTRQSITDQKPIDLMDARVRPGHDEKQEPIHDNQV
jgi:hypothetical protein